VVITTKRIFDARFVAGVIPTNPQRCCREMIRT
jgi:hypothetical protein